MNNKINSSSQQTTLWEQTALPCSPLSSLGENIKADVAVIGAGVAGLSSALHLAKSGLSVVVIEAEVPGAGATGQSGGLLAPDFIRHTPSQIEKIFGQEDGEKLIRLVGKSTEQCRQLIKENNISCDLQWDGFLTPAHNKAISRQLQNRAEEWKIRGYNVDYISETELKGRIKSNHYCGAIYFKDGGSLNPLSYIRGLVSEVLKHGGEIYINSPVTGLKQCEGGWQVKTNYGFVEAKKVILAANGGNSSLHPALKNTILPLDVYEYATNVFSNEQYLETLPFNQAFTDKQSYIFTARFDVSKRLIGALPGSIFKRDRKSLISEATKRTTSHFPFLREFTIDYLWQGTAWLNTSLLPKVYDLKDGAYAIQACNGRGIAINTVLGKEVAEVIIHNDPKYLSLKLSKPGPIRGYGVVQYVPSLLMALAYLKNKIKW